MGCLNSKATAEKTKTPSKPAPKKAPTKKTDAKTVAAPKAVATKQPPPAAEAEPKAAETAAKEPNPQNVAETFLKTVLEGAEHFFSALPDSQVVKQVVALTFMNSCVEVTRTKYRLKMDALVELINKLTQELKLPLLGGAMKSVEERNMDDSFSRVLLAWYTNNPSLTKKIPAEAAQTVLNTLYIRYTVNKQTSFEDVLVYQFRWITINQASLEVFAKFTEGKECMTADQMGRFLRETQGIEITDRQLSEKHKFRFGGAIHRYNFASYNGSVLTNNAIDPSRTTDVWQDMTQSFTHYLVQSARIESDEDMKRAIADNCRAWVLNIKKGKNDKLCSGSCDLHDVAEAIKKNGFTTNTYPIVLCLSPGEVLPVDVQTEVANLLTESLGSFIAKGLMFEGAVISDPMFSPGALRKKVLIMGHQSALKAFIGFMVADMNKDGLGVRVTDVIEGTPASKGGILKDDWLTDFNEGPIHNKQHLRESLAKLKVGEEFTVKRENLDEIKIVVGGVVNPDDKSVSPELSGITFFDYVKDSKTYKPWDTECLDVTKQKQLTADPKAFSDHFAVISVNAEKQSEQETTELMTKAGGAGVQFVDVDNSERCLSWARGRFYDNGRCGYLLKTDMDNEKSPDIAMNVIVGPRAMGCPALASATVKVFGGGSARQTGSQITFTGCSEGTIAVVEMKFESGGTERSFTASFCPALVRTGYRALPSIPTGEERLQKKQIHGVYLFVKRS